MTDSSGLEEKTRHVVLLSDSTLPNVDVSEDIDIAINRVQYGISIDADSALTESSIRSLPSPSQTPLSERE